MTTNAIPPADDARALAAPPSPAPRAAGWALILLMSAATSTGAVLAYHLSRPVPVRFATLDVAQLFTERQEALMKLATEGTGEAGTQKAVELAKTFGRQLEAEALALPRACGCIVLVRGAVVAGGDLPDYTDAIRERLKQR